MVSRVLKFSAVHWGSKLPDLAARLVQWWLTEFLGLFPGNFSEWLMDRGYKKLTLVAEPEAIVLQLSSDGLRPLASVRISRHDYSSASIDDFLHTKDLNREQASIGIRIARDQVFARRLMLPLE